MFDMRGIKYFKQPMDCSFSISRIGLPDLNQFIIICFMWLIIIQNAI